MLELLRDVSLVVVVAPCWGWTGGLGCLVAVPGVLTSFLLRGAGYPLCVICGVDEVPTEAPIRVAAGLRGGDEFV